MPTITITRERRIHALVDDTAKYPVEESLWDEALTLNHDDEDAALAYLLDNGFTEASTYEADVVDVLAVHTTELSQGDD